MKLISVAEAFFLARGEPDEACFGCKSVFSWCAESRMKLVSVAEAVFALRDTNQHFNRGNVFCAPPYAKNSTKKEQEQE